MLVHVFRAKLHRVVVTEANLNYMGSINPENRERGLKKLDNLLVQIIKKWPEVEFITSMELGDIITGKTQEK